ncbi:DNRLRE domain-containing protein [Streptacidiphilus sp. P02-A3a]|uniref:DNRLRE domain-containing protein n=1 Tax=Streptacidiphilus sp. P02-A3a TaxID=2704468 RepID=UPI0015F7AC0D|nr:DNRLRE domain-containing protein [Streptacidiphilus sp. P02-A3a]QMU71741.1 DNRLRE domain-containing protein [Streptacidiphilus sp. P02-A3a]
MRSRKIMSGGSPLPSRRLTATAVSAGLTISLLGAATGVSEVQAEGVAVRSAVVPVASRPDAVSAMLAAKRQGSKVEVLGDRTDASQTFADPDGTFSYQASEQPRWVEQGGSWKSLDATLTTDGSGDVVPTLSESPLVLSGGGSGPLATMTVDGKTTTLSWPTALPKPTLAGDTATYADVLSSGADLQVTATAAGGIEETLVVKNAAAAVDPRLADLQLAIGSNSGSTVSVDAGGNLNVDDAKGRLLVNSPAPVMWDSSTTASTGNAAPSSASSPGSPVAGGADADGPLKVRAAARPSATAQGSRSTAQTPGSHAHTARVAVSFDKRTHKLALAADQGLLKSKNTVFPVYVDPAYTPHPASGATMNWDQVQQAYPTTSNYDAAPGTGLAVGYQGFSSPTGIERTFYEISVPSAIYGATVISAKLNAKVTYAAAAGSNSTTIQAFSTGPMNSSTDWNNQPSKDTGANNPNYPSPNGSATFTTTSTSPNQAVSFDVTSGLQNVAKNKADNWTLGLYNATETNDTDFVRFADNPTFSITYNNPPATPGSLLLSPAGTVGSTVYTADSTPTLSAAATDANSDTVRLDYQVLSGTTVKASGSSAFVNSGATGTWSPASALADGAYTWQVRAYDGHEYSAWSAAKAFTVDTAAPARPQAQSTAWPQNQWTSATSGTFNWTDGSSDVNSYSYWMDSATTRTTVSASTTATGTLTVASGAEHVFHLVATDRAGNTSQTDYFFGSGTTAGPIVTSSFYLADAALRAADSGTDTNFSWAAVSGTGSYGYSEDGGTAQTLTSDTTSLAWYPDAGSHTLSVWGVSASGVRTPAGTFAFSVAPTVAPSAPTALSSIGTDTTTPLLGGATSGLGGGTVDVFYYLTDAAGNAVGQTPYAHDEVDAGNRSMLSIPDGTLTPGATYRWWMTACHDQACSADSVHQSLVIQPSASPTPQTTTVTLPVAAVADREAPVTATASSTGGSLLVGSDGSQVWRSYLTVDLSSLPAGSFVTDATLNLGAASALGSGGAVTVDADAVSGAWDATTTGDALAALAGDQLSSTQVTPAQTATIEIGDALDSWMAGDPNNGITLLADDETVGNGVSFDSTRKTGGTAPTVTVTYLAPTTPGAPTDLSVQAGDGDALATWTAPESVGANGPVGYTVTVLDPSGAVQQTQQVSRPEAQVTGLTDTVPYTVQVVTHTGYGDSGPVSAPVTPSAASTGTGDLVAAVGQYWQARDALLAGSTDDSAGALAGASQSALISGLVQGEAPDVLTLRQLSAMHSGDSQALTAVAANSPLVLVSPDASTISVEADITDTIASTDTDGTTSPSDSDNERTFVFTRDPQGDYTLTDFYLSDALVPVATIDATAATAEVTTAGGTTQQSSKAQLSAQATAPDVSDAPQAVTMDANGWPAATPSSPVHSLASYRPSLNQTAAVKWAQAHYNDSWMYNPDCTAWASRVLHDGGGMAYHDSSLLDYNNDSYWWRKTGIFGTHQTYSYSGAQHLANFLSSLSGNWVAYTGQAQPGDVIFYRYPGWSSINHTAVVVDVNHSTGELWVAQSDDNYKHRSIYDQIASIEKQYHGKAPTIYIRHLNF